MKKGIIFVPFMTGKGGTETVIHNLFRAFTNDDDFSLKVFSIGGSDDYGWTQGVNIKTQTISSHRIIRTLYYATFLPIKIYHTLLKENPDFVISTNPVMWYFAKKSLLFMKKDTPVIAWYHYSLKQKPIKQFLLKSADFFLAISTGIKKQLIDLGIDNQNIFLVYNPIDSNHIIIPRPTDIPHFIYLGRVDLDGQKNVRELIDGLSDVRGMWLLDIYGDDKNADSVKKYIIEKNIEKHINWKGFVSNPWDSIANATCLLLTSKYEGLPMVLCEAISHGIFCISSDIETGPSDIINNYNGKLYPSGDIKQLTSILQNIVDEPQKLPKQSTIISTSNKFSLLNYHKYFHQALDLITK